MTIGRGFQKADDLLGDKSGYWETTSSVDFCETNYVYSRYIAEPHNLWSSLFLCYLGIVGVIYCNPMKELRVTLMFGIIFFVGMGSSLLHTTLDKLAQSTDELPMLWFNIVASYSLFELTAKRGYNKYTFSALGGCLFALIQALIYYGYQQIYIVFLVSYSGTVAIMTVWSYMLIHNKNEILDIPTPILKKSKSNNSKNNSVNDYAALALKDRSFLWHRSLAFYVFFGAIPWILDMHYCTELKPYSDLLPFMFKGMTLHVIWHIFAGLGTYYYIVFLVLVRTQTLYKKTILSFKFGLPIVTKISNDINNDQDRYNLISDNNAKTNNVIVKRAIRNTRSKSPKSRKVKPN
jgi:dihydroceramidase